MHVGSALEATNRSSRARQPGAIHRSPSGLSDRRQQTAAAALALQAGGRPFEPGTAHHRGSGPEAASAGGTSGRTCRERCGPLPPSCRRGPDPGCPGTSRSTRSRPARPLPQAYEQDRPAVREPDGGPPVLAPFSELRALDRDILDPRSPERPSERPRRSRAVRNRPVPYPGAVHPLAGRLGHVPGAGDRVGDSEQAGPRVGVELDSLRR